MTIPVQQGWMPYIWEKTCNGCVHTANAFSPGKKAGKDKDGNAILGCQLDGWNNLSNEIVACSIVMEKTATVIHVVAQVKILKNFISVIDLGPKAKNFYKYCIRPLVTAMEEGEKGVRLETKIKEIAAFANVTLASANFLRQMKIFDLGKFCAESIGPTRLYGIAGSCTVSVVKNSCVVVMLISIIIETGNKHQIFMWAYTNVGKVVWNSNMETESIKKDDKGKDLDFINLGITACKLGLVVGGGLVGVTATWFILFAITANTIALGKFLYDGGGAPVDFAMDDVDGD